MIGDINNFVLSSRSLENGTTTLTFEFDKPSGDYGAYKLYQKLAGGGFEEAKLRIDYAHYKEDYEADYTYEANNKVYFEYSFGPGITDGRLIEFRLRAISVANELSNPSSTLDIYIAPSIPTNFLTTYNGYEINLDWDDLNTSTGMNSHVLNFIVRRKGVTEIPTSAVEYDTETYTLTHTSFTKGSALWVIDIAKRSKWFGNITTEGEFVLSDANKITLSSDTASNYTILKDNLRFLIEKSSDITNLGYPTTSAFIDTTFTIDYYYIYTVAVEGGDSQESEEVKFPLFAIDVNKAYPYLRSPGNSDNEILQQPYWKYLKEVLIDANYYDKTQFAIPFFKHEEYNLKGYIGVSECKVDIFVNNIYDHTVISGTYGEFDIDYPFKKGETEIYIQARDKYNIKFSRKSAPYSIRTLNMYTWFSALGKEYKEIVDTILEIRNTVDITNVTYGVYQDVYAPFIEIYKSGDEDSDAFMTMASEVFKAFEYAAYDKSLEMVLDAFQAKIPEFDHYELFFNNDHVETHKSGGTFTYRDSVLSGLNYWYGISAFNTSTGAETDATTIRVDRRWWERGYNGINVITWDEIKNADNYKIYKGSDEEELAYITTTPANLYCDIGQHAEIVSNTPRLFNYTSLDKPSNIVVDNGVYVTKIHERLKKPNAMTIVLFGVGYQEIPDMEMYRIRILLDKLIPPEIRYTLLFARDPEVDVIIGKEITANGIHYMLSGDIWSGLYLDITNSNPLEVVTSNEVPEEYLTYTDIDGSTEEYDNIITAIYQSDPQSDPNGFSHISWEADGDPGDIMFQYRISEDGITFNAWSEEIDAIENSIKVFSEDPVSFEYRLVFYSPNWSDTDNVRVLEIV